MKQETITTNNEWMNKSSPTYIISRDSTVFVSFIGWLIAVIPYAAGFPFSGGRLALSMALFRVLM